jgi:hypothetical protein
VLTNSFKPLTPELNPYAQSCLPGFLLGILIFKWLTARRLCNLFGVKGLTEWELFLILFQNVGNQSTRRHITEDLNFL